MSFMIPLNQVESLRTRTVLLIGIDLHRDRIGTVPGLRDGMRPGGDLLIVPPDAIFDGEGEMADAAGPAATPRRVVERSASAPAVGLAYPLPAGGRGLDDWDTERWDGLS